MKKIYLLLLTFISTINFGQTATNFNVNDCSGNNHDLFTELNSGKVIVICWVMPCSACIAPSLSAYTQVQNYQSSHPNKVLFYLVDDYANTSCPTLTSWALTNGMPNSTFFSNAAINMNDYGSTGMPKIVVLGGANHLVFDNQNNSLNTTQFNNAINQALLASSISVKENQGKTINYSIYPNPVEDNKIIISGDFTADDKTSMELYNILGSQVKSLSYTELDKNKYEITLDRQIKNGVYFLNITHKGLTYSSKLIINNR